MVDHRDRRLDGADVVVCRAVHEAPRQDVDGGVERRGEQHPLAAGRRHVKQPPHDGQESEVGHVVRLVEHAYFHVAKVAVALLDEIGQPAGHATTISARSRSLATCGFWGTPP